MLPLSLRVFIKGLKLDSVIMIINHHVYVSSTGPDTGYKKNLG